MSQLVNYTSSGNVKQAGAKVGSFLLSAAAAAATAIIADGGVTVCALSVAAAGSIPYALVDSGIGHEFTGQPSITLTGAGAALTVEWL